MDKATFMAQAEAHSRQAIAEDYALRKHVFDREEQALAAAESRKRRSWYDCDLEDVPVCGFYAMWETGGMSGGNCWGGEASSYIADEPAKELAALDTFLEEHFPTIPFLAYKRLVDKAEAYTKSEHEYYGNRTDYALRYLPFDALWESLVKAKLVDDE